MSDHWFLIVALVVGFGIKFVFDGCKSIKKSSFVKVTDFGGGECCLDFKDGNVSYFYKGEPHREDGPAISKSDGTKKWYRFGDLHREDGPAIQMTDMEEWWLNGRRHRKDGPALTIFGQRQEWWEYGKLIKSSYVVKSEKNKRTTLVSTEDRKYEKTELRLNGKLHSTTGPAVCHKDGTKEWWLNGKRHREDGPAIIRPDGKEEWWVDGVRQVYKSHQEEQSPSSEYSNKKSSTKRQPITLGFRRFGLDKPTLVKKDGTRYWRQDGKIHREDGPAIIRPDGTKEWWLNGFYVGGEFGPNSVEEGVDL